MSTIHSKFCFGYALIIAWLRVFLGHSPIAEYFSMVFELVLVISLFDMIAYTIKRK